MMPLLSDIRQSPLLWLLAVVPVLLAVELLRPGAHTLLFILSIVAIVPLAALLSRATESVAARIGDAMGGLLNATLGNLTELLIALTALRAGEYVLVKASLAGAIVSNSLFMLGTSFFIGGLKHHMQTFNRDNTRLQAGLLLLATLALLIPSAVADTSGGSNAKFVQLLSVCLSVLLIVTYGLGLFFSLRTHAELFGAAHHEMQEGSWSMSLSLMTLAGVTGLIAFVSHIFISSLEHAASTFGITPAFVGFVIVPLVSAPFAAWSGAVKNRMDLSVGVALGSATQIALFVAPVMVLASLVLGPTPMDLQFWPGAVAMMLMATAAVALVTGSGRSAWFPGLLLTMIYIAFAMTLYLMPPAVK